MDCEPLTNVDNIVKHWIATSDEDFATTAMDKRDAISTARRFAQEVQARYGAARFILFGSYAKGNFHEDSDIDLAIIFDECENVFNRDVELMVMSHNVDWRIEPHSFVASEFTVEDPLAYEVMKYGSEIT
jgi:predicted nucleotidyltransferase